MRYRIVMNIPLASKPRFFAGNARTVTAEPHQATGHPIDPVEIADKKVRNVESIFLSVAESPGKPATK